MLAKDGSGFTAVKNHDIDSDGSNPYATMRGRAACF